MKERVALRGLARLAGRIFGVWGGLLVVKGGYDCFGGQPEANYFSPEPWQFVTHAEWLRYAGFEVTYGVACLGLAWFAARLARTLPEFVEREKPGEIF